jgi:hypothetical protein
LLAFFQFGAPALLMGIGAAALPFVIHLLLRPRPRRVRFPPVTFLGVALASGQRAQRLRNFWLLAVRALLLACAAMLLAGPTCAPLETAPDIMGPTACVLVVDDSWSMRYQLDEEATLLDRARAAALDVTRSAADWPQPSELGLVWPDPAEEVVELTEDHAVVRTRLRAPGAQTPHALPLGHALQEAAGWLGAARQPNRRLVVFTDQAAHAWRDVAPGLLTGIENLSVSVRAIGPARRSNIAITAAHGPPRVHPETMPVRLEVTLGAAGLDATCFLVLREDGRVVERVGPLRVPADAAQDLSLALPPRAAGPHAWELEVEPGDRLSFDQKRYVVFETGERPVAWLLTPAEAGPDTDLTALLLRNLLAPEALEAERQLVAFRQLTPADLAAPVADETEGDKPAADGRDIDLLVVTSGVELNEAERRAVRQQAERGATVLLLPGSRDGPTDWPGLRRLLARAVLRADKLDSVMSFAWDENSSFAGRGEALDELTRTAVRRRVVLAGLEKAVIVEARYADGVPAILSLPRGHGRFVLLTTSPDPRWSELGMRAAGLLTWLHELLQESRRLPGAVTTFTAAEVTRRSFPGLPSRATARVLLLTDEGGKVSAVRLADGQPEGGWPTDQPGIYAVRTSGGGTQEIRYAVNWPAEESDLTPIEPDRLQVLLGVADVAIERVASTLAEAKPSVFSRLLGGCDAARALPLVLLGFVLLELRLASHMRSAAGRQ